MHPDETKPANSNDFLDFLSKPAGRLEPIDMTPAPDPAAPDAEQQPETNPDVLALRRTDMLAALDITDPAAVVSQELLQQRIVGYVSYVYATDERGCLLADLNRRFGKLCAQYELPLRAFVRAAVVRGDLSAYLMLGKSLVVLPGGCAGMPDARREAVLARTLAGVKKPRARK